MRAFIRSQRISLGTARTGALAAVLATATVVALPGTSSAAAGAGTRTTAGASTAARSAAPMAYVVNEFSSTLSGINLSTNAVDTIPAAATNGIGADATSVVATPNGKQAYVLSSYGGSLSHHSVTVIDAATGSVEAEIPLKGASYSHLVFSPNGDRAYLLGDDSAGSFIATIDTRTHQVLDFPYDGRATDLVLSPDGAKIYTVDGQTGGITVLDAATGKHLAAFSGGDRGASQLLLSPDAGTLYILHDDATLREISTATEKTVSTVTLGPVGFRPTLLTLSPNGATMYVLGVRDYSGTATSVDLATGKVSAPITVTGPSMGTPRNIALSPNGSAVYVSGPTLGRVYVINPATWTLTSTIQAWGDPVATFSADGTKAYIVGEDSVRVIDTATGTVTATIATGLQPAAVVLADHGARALVVNTRSDDLSVIDTATDKILTTVPGGEDRPVTELLTRDGRFAYVMGTGDSILKIDLGNRKVAAIIPLGGTVRYWVMSPDGTELYVAKYTGKIDVISTSTDKVDAEIDLGDTGPLPPMFSPDGSTVYVPLQYSDEVAVIGTATHAVTAKIPSGGYMYNATLSPDGSKLYLDLGYKSVSVIDTATDTVGATVSLPAGSFASNVTFSPDSSLAYLASTPNDDVYVVDTATNTVTATIPVAGAFKVAFSADGTKAYVLGGRGSTDTFSVIDTATNAVTETTPLTGFIDPQIVLSADGSTAYVVCSTGCATGKVDGGVYALDTATGALADTIAVGEHPQQMAISSGRD